MPRGWFSGLLFVTIGLGVHTFSPVPRPAPVYFLPLPSYMGALALLWGVALAAIARRSRWAKVLLPFLALTVGYAVVEAIVPVIPYKIPLPLDPSRRELVSIVNDYLLGRSFQYLPLLLLAAYAASLRISPRHLIRPGDLAAPTDAVRPHHPEPWRRVLIRVILLLLAGGTISFLVTHPPIPRGSSALLLALGALNNSFIEEALFRGLLLPLWANAVGFPTANLLQAALFGLFHFPSLNPIHYAFKVIVFTFFGWLWGRAAWETGGIGAGLLMHTAVVLAVLFTRA